MQYLNTIGLKSAGLRPAKMIGNKFRQLKIPSRHNLTVTNQQRDDKEPAWDNQGRLSSDSKRGASAGASWTKSLVDSATNDAMKSPRLIWLEGPMVKQLKAYNSQCKACREKFSKVAFFESENQFLKKLFRYSIKESEQRKAKT